eukprot:514067-Amphidinium_carterae.2
MAETFNMHFSASFEQSKFGVHGSTLMAHLWANRMNYICLQWIAAGSPAVTFQGSETITFEVSSETDLYIKGLTNPSARKRAEQILKMWPS